MYALEIINALNDPDNPAKPKGLNAKLKGKLELDEETGATVWTPPEEVSTQDELDEVQATPAIFPGVKIATIGHRPTQGMKLCHQH